jgi:hypothetical protein
MHGVIGFHVWFQLLQMDLIRDPLLCIHVMALLATFHTGLLLGLFFDPEDGSDMFLRNVS